MFLFFVGSIKCRLYSNLTDEIIAIALATETKLEHHPADPWLIKVYANSGVVYWMTCIDLRSRNTNRNMPCDNIIAFRDGEYYWFENAGTGDQIHESTIFVLP